MYNTSDYRDTIATDCQYGWEYDQTWYTSTAVTQENWICNNKLHVTNVFVFTKVGDFLGTFIFGQIGDLILFYRVGRKPTFYITLSVLFVGRVMSVFTSKYIWVFAFAALLGNLATPSVFQSPLTIAMEISKNENRAKVQFAQALGSTTALCLMPFVYWIFKDWVPFMLLTSLPCGIYLFSCKWFVESPRWLASRQKTKKCINELEKIARVNGRELDDEVLVILEKNTHSKEATYGFMSLFSNWALAKKTILLMIIWGNPFLNYFFQGLAELPAALFGKYFCDKMGRRWAHRYAFIAAAFSSVVMAVTINNNDLLWLTSMVVVFLKFFTTIAWYAINLHTIEMFPTCIRQTGIAFCVITASAVSTTAPYIVYLGTSVNLKYPYFILGGMAVIGATTGLFLSETLNQSLPETIDDVRNKSNRNKTVLNSVNNVNNAEEIKLTHIER
ncbi:solute carrier family 22 member [Holotrichia oblita]|uniref:Solute carrier family 22 member n=1 Tax=Holotrichia oblita TaxID=644536 RepID=A0ACB9TJN0_HOLOL|nr:solute carrier family 22 member [Holotrichia oblita]